jgi:hypothetical protein
MAPARHFQKDADIGGIMVFPMQLFSHPDYLPWKTI